MTQTSRQRDQTLEWEGKREKREGEEEGRILNRADNSHPSVHVSALWSGPYSWKECVDSV